MKNRLLIHSGHVLTMAGPAHPEGCVYIEDGKIIGEMTMQPYGEEEAKMREKQIDAWLSSMLW